MSESKTTTRCPKCNAIIGGNIHYELCQIPAQLDAARGMYKALRAPEIVSVIGQCAYAHAFKYAGGMDND